MLSSSSTLDKPADLNKFLAVFVQSALVLLTDSMPAKPSGQTVKLDREKTKKYTVLSIFPEFLQDPTEDTECILTTGNVIQLVRVGSFSGHFVLCPFTSTAFYIRTVRKSFNLLHFLFYLVK